jgi:regulatory protein
VPIDHQQPTERGSDPGSLTDGQALSEAREWLQRQGVGAPPGVTDQPVRRTFKRPVNSAHRPPSSRNPREPSPRSDDVDADVESVARTIALRKLTARACTRHELDQALQAKNVPQGVIDAVLDRLQDVGLLDDASFALDWVTSRQQRRHMSRRLLRRELQAKGVERSHIDSALDQVDRNAELTSARDLVERKRAAMNGVAREIQYRRLAGMLSRRGFDSSITTQVLADVLGE